MGRSAPIFAAAVVALAGNLVGCPDGVERPGTPPGRLGKHDVRVDAHGVIAPWPTAPSPFAEVARLAWTELERFPVQPNGLPTYMAHSRFDPDELWGVSWPHNPAGLYAMLTESALAWRRYSGDDDAVALAERTLAHLRVHGTTPAAWPWARVPFASADPGAVDYGGADDSWCGGCGRGDGVDVVEPDKIGEAGFAYLRMFEATGNVALRDAGVACADALAAHVRDGDDTRSPWPFRVNARTGDVREEYSADVLAPITLFDELTRLGIGDVASYRAARARAFTWLMQVPMRTDAWSGYFEDIEVQTDPNDNPNQYLAVSVAEWLLDHRDEDPAWRAHAGHLLEWAMSTFAVDTATESGRQWGAVVMSEQRADMAKMGSHTARFGAASVLWGAATGDVEAIERGRRSLAWATYACDDRGVVAVGEDANEGWWFTDGYGDYIRHFMTALGAMPEWAAPGENHVVRSTSVVQHVAYGADRVVWSTFDDDATETLRLVSAPRSVTAGGQRLDLRDDLQAPGYVVGALASGGVALRVRHAIRGDVVVTTAPVPATTSPADLAPRGGRGCGR